MAKIFESQFEKGSLIDGVSGVVMTPTNTSFEKTEKGLAVVCNGTSKLTLNRTLTVGTVYTAEFWTKRIGKAVLYGVMSGSLLTDGYSLFFDGTNGVWIHDGTSNNRSNLISSLFNNSNWHHIIAIRNNMILDFYIDGVHTGTFGNLTTNVPLSIDRLFVRGTNSLYFKGYCAKYRVYNHVFTEAERAKAYSDFLNSYPMLPEKYPQQGILNKPMDLSRYSGSGAGQGLVTAYNMIPTGNTLVDISGNGNNGSIVNCTTTKKGIKSIYGKKSTIGLSTIAVGTIWTLNVRIKDPIPVASSPLVSPSSGLNPSIQFTTNVTFRDISGNAYPFATTVASLFGKEATLSFVSNGTTITLYVNGISDSSVITPTSTSLTIANIFGNTNWFGILEVIDFRLYNYNQSIQQVKNYHNQFVQSYLIEDFSSEGADGIAKVPTGWIKQSGSFKIGEWQPISLSNIFNSATINFDGGNWTAYSGWQIADGVASRPIYNGSAGSLYLINAAGNPLNIGRLYRCRYKLRKINTFAGKIQLLNSSSVVYNCLNTLNEQLFTFYSYDRNFRFYGDGSWNGEIDWCVIEEIPPLPTFKPGTKYLECVTAGVLSIPSKQAYGTWEFDWYKGGLSNVIDGILIASKPNSRSFATQNGYFLRIESNEAYFLYKTTNGSATAIANSSASYISNNTWYRVKIIRTLSGVFTVLIKGGSFTPTTGYDGWTLVSTTGGSGTNPVTDNTYTTSEYFVLDIDAGDRIANIKLTDGIKQ